MKEILLSHLREISSRRPAGFYEEAIGRGRIETSDVLVLEDDVYLEFQDKFAPPHPISDKVVQPIPRKDWPLWAKALAMIATPEDKGIGDVVARTIGAENSEAFKKWFKATTGKDCGCTGRHARLNRDYPLP